MDLRRFTIGRGFRANGRPTFARIWQNLQEIHRIEDDFKIIVRLHVDHTNVERVPEFLSCFENSFERDPRFVLYIRELSRLGGPGDGDLEVLQGKEVHDVISRLRFLASSMALPLDDPGEQYTCYAAKLNSFVMRADGRIGKCTVALNSELNDIGKICEDGTMQLRSERLFPWARGLESGDESELTCPLAGLIQNKLTAIVSEASMIP